MQRIIGVAAAFGVLTLWASPVLAGPALDACANEASSRMEPGFADVGKFQYEIVVGTAIAACRKALVLSLIHI